MKWSEEQELAISLRRRRLLVSAAAGSGKTAVLTERIFRRITDERDPVELDALLIMTFTRAAAAEMRERIRRRLTDELERESAEHGNSARNALLMRQNALLDAAKITTIDSFCLSILREHADLTDLDPSFRVGGEDELSLMKADVMEGVLEDAYAAETPEFLKFVGGFSQGKTDRGIRELLLSVWQFAESSPWPDEWLSDCEAEAQQNALRAENAAGSPWFQYILREMRAYGEGYARMAGEALQICDAENGPSGYRSAVQTEKRQLEKLSRAESAEELREALSSFTWQRLGRNPKTADPEAAETVKRMRGSWKGDIQRFEELFGTGDSEMTAADLRNEAETVLTVTGLVREFRRRYTEKKRERNLLDFGDLEHLSLDLLWEKEPDGSRKRSALAEEYAGRFREIFVDEYQDSNGVQEALLRAIDGGELFLVGDVKQSIYGFRQARPELFSEKYERYEKCTPSHAVPEGTDTRVDLSRNFRSRDEVLDTANRVFSVLMDRAVGGIAYDEDAALRPGASYPENREQPDAYRTELLLTSRDSATGEGDALAAEAHLIAGRIRELVSENGLLVTDRQSGSLRRAEYGDIALLLRSAEGRAEQFVEVLLSEGIPAEAEQKRGYFDAPEVQTALSLLSAIDNPMQDIPLAAALRSPACALTERELALLTAEEKALARETSAAHGGPEELSASGRGQESAPAEDVPDEKTPQVPLSLYDRLCLVRDTGKYPETERKLKGFLDFLDRSAEQSLYLPLPEFIRNVLEESGCLAWAAALPGGSVRKANLDMLSEKAEGFEAAGYRGLYDFVRYIENLRKYDTDYGEAGTGEERGGAVRVMTIHKSKGLEFPVVFLAGLSGKFNRRDLSAGIIIDQKFGIAADAVDLSARTRAATLKKNVLAQRKKEEMYGEEIRVLYVAMTRAAEKLILTAAPADPARAADAALARRTPRRAEISEILSAGSMLDWILLAMSRDDTHCGISLRIVDPAEAAEKRREDGAMVRAMRKELRALEDAPLTAAGEAFLRTLEEPYPFEADVNLQVKRSVSEIKFRGQDEDDADALRPSYALPEEEKRVPDGAGKRAPEGAKARGTVIHRVMEKLDYRSVRDSGSMEQFLDELLENGTLTTEERSGLGAGDFAAFLSSDLCRRMRRAFLCGTLHREAQFVMSIPAREADPGIASGEPVLVQGIIDAWFEEDGKLILLDYKTDRNVTAEMLRERYRTQLLLYRRALGMMEGREVSETLLWSFSLGAEICL